MGSLCHAHETGAAPRGKLNPVTPELGSSLQTTVCRMMLSNGGDALILDRLGMFVTLSFQTGSGQRLTLVPRSAVQSIGDRTVVYLPVEGEEGKFNERPVKLGPAAGDFMHVR